MIRTPEIAFASCIVLSGLACAGQDPGQARQDRNRADEDSTSLCIGTTAGGLTRAGLDTDIILGQQNAERFARDDLAFCYGDARSHCRQLGQRLTVWRAHGISCIELDSLTGLFNTYKCQIVADWSCEEITCVEDGDCEPFSPADSVALSCVDGLCEASGY